MTYTGLAHPVILPCLTLFSHFTNRHKGQNSILSVSGSKKQQYRQANHQGNPDFPLKHHLASQKGSLLICILKNQNTHTHIRPFSKAQILSICPVPSPQLPPDHWSLNPSALSIIGPHHQSHYLLFPLNLPGLSRACESYTSYPAPSSPCPEIFKFHVLFYFCSWATSAT